MKKIIIITGLWMVLVSLSGFEAAYAAEPNMADYTSYPVFMATTVEPNILIMLDNSGSMNDQAYTDEYGGSVYQTVERQRPACGASTDDAEESLDDDSVLINTTNLYLGEGEDEVCIRWRQGRCRRWTTEYFDTMVGLRFRNVEVPPGAVITNAYITFQAYTNGSGNASITIRGEDVGNARLLFSTTAAIFPTGLTPVHR